MGTNIDFGLAMGNTCRNLLFRHIMQRYMAIAITDQDNKLDKSISSESDCRKINSYIF